MITSINISNHLGESIAIETRFPEKSGFLIRDIDGLGPTKAIINTTEILGLDGAVYNSSRSTSRNIVLTISFVGATPVELLRQKLYRYFQTKQAVDLIIHGEHRSCRTYGYVESVAVDMFSSDETVVVSILCPDSYLYAEENMEVLFSGYEPNFEFPFSNESLSTSEMEIGVVSIKTRNVVHYPGDAPTGILIYINAIGPVTNLNIYNLKTREELGINDDRLLALTGGLINTGDQILISTIKGSKSITLLRDGVYTNILNCLKPWSNWFQLSVGDNLFAYTADPGGETNLQFRIVSPVAYGGL